MKVGDRVVRYLGGNIPFMNLSVTEVTDTLGPWTFDRVTGAEVDADLGWGATAVEHG